MLESDKPLRQPIAVGMETIRLQLERLREGPTIWSISARNFGIDERRFYQMETWPDLFGRPLLLRRWGGIGTPGRQHLDPHPDGGAALNALDNEPKEFGAGRK